MKHLFSSAAAALAIATLAPAAAPAQTYPSASTSDFWRAAPADAWNRISYLEQRINDGVRDGSLTAGEAARARAELRQVRRQAMRLRRRDRGMTSADARWVQRRLDRVGANVRWMRHDGVGYGDRGVSTRYATNWDARRYYRTGPQYRERRLTAADQVYRGSDGRYYCKRSDGTTGLVMGAAAGGLLGNLIDGGHNRLAGTLIGGALGALTGRAIDQNTDIRCR